jgi:hypothetical protein
LGRVIAGLTRNPLIDVLIVDCLCKNNLEEPTKNTNANLHQVGIQFLSPRKQFAFNQANARTCLDSFDFRFPALFLWITFFFANLSSIEHTLGYSSLASVWSDILRNFLTALRAVFA